MANIPVSFSRSIALAAVVSSLTVVISVAAGLGFRRRFPGSGVLFYLAVASLVMPSLLVGFGIGLGFQFLGIEPSLFTSALGAQLTWTLPFGLFAMFAVVNRFNRVVGGSGDRPRRQCLAAAAPRHHPDPAAGHHRRGDGRVHPVL